MRTTEQPLERYQVVRFSVKVIQTPRGLSEDDIEKIKQRLRDAAKAGRSRRMVSVVV